MTDEKDPLEAALAFEQQHPSGFDGSRILSTDYRGRPVVNSVAAFVAHGLQHGGFADRPRNAAGVARATTASVARLVQVLAERGLLDRDDVRRIVGNL